jgi:hypothetical protein
MNRDNLINEKLQKVCDYGKQLEGKTFTSSKKNDMARAVIFEMNWQKFMVFSSRCHDTWTTEEEDKGIELLDFLIQVWEAAPETWELFWQGKQPDNPKKMPFNCVGQEQLRFIDLTEVAQITIPMMGFK